MTALTGVVSGYKCSRTGTSTAELSPAHLGKPHDKLPSRPPPQILPLQLAARKSLCGSFSKNHRMALNSRVPSGSSFHNLLIKSSGNLQRPKSLWIQRTQSPAEGVIREITFRGRWSLSGVLEKTHHFWGTGSGKFK